MLLSLPLPGRWAANIRPRDIISGKTRDLGLFEGTCVGFRLIQRHSISQLNERKNSKNC